MNGLRRRRNGLPYCLALNHRALPNPRSHSPCPSRSPISQVPESPLLGRSSHPSHHSHPKVVPTWKPVPLVPVLPVAHRPGSMEMIGTDRVCMPGMKRHHSSQCSHRNSHRNSPDVATSPRGSHWDWAARWSVVAPAPVAPRSAALASPPGWALDRPSQALDRRVPCPSSCGCARRRLGAPREASLSPGVSWLCGPSSWGTDLPRTRPPQP
mmetsp:Transcript_57331/g.125548  ORF Transcript_57331/g.125548 Transcript_57331/m.125548 type:complete len:211 (-) Transcript_57331:106-738(-)